MQVDTVNSLRDANPQDGYKYVSESFAAQMLLRAGFTATDLSRMVWSVVNDLGDEVTIQRGPRAFKRNSHLHTELFAVRVILFPKRTTHASHKCAGDTSTYVANMQRYAPFQITSVLEAQYNHPRATREPAPSTVAHTRQHARLHHKHAA